ncbi:MAG: nuclear transport factor 2 family protein [Candidatus Korobacteraceae bacterium]
MMRRYCVLMSVVALIATAFAQVPAAPSKSGESAPIGSVSTDPAVKTMFEAKVKAEWEAVKNKDKKAYGALLADDYQGVGVDGRGERNKIQSINDLADQNPFNYTLERVKVLPLGENAAFVIYDVTILFPPKAQLRFSRVYIGEVWVKRSGEWQLLHYQETHVR